MIKKFIGKIITITLLIASLFSLTSCSIGMLGDFYFVQDNKIKQQITFKVTNVAILTTNRYDGDIIISTEALKTKWQRASVLQKNENGEPIIDLNGNYVYDETINLLYYDNDVKHVIQFHLVDGTLIDYYFNSEFNTYRQFERRK